MPVVGKLTETQMRTLIWIWQNNEQYGEDAYGSPPGTKWTTLRILQRKGLVAVQHRPTVDVGCITTQGVIFLREVKPELFL